MSTRYVDSIFDAIRLASELKAEGRYDWFRGQRQNWPLTPSLYRHSQQQQQLDRERILTFARWLQVTPGLREIATNPNAVLAVAQHYGIPTTFIDFTTEPRIAGFFASTNISKEHESEGNGCILCLNTKELRDFWLDMPEKYRRTEFVQLQVANLWRLEAQAGVFLFCPYKKFDQLYDIDRILFPHSVSELLTEPIYEEVYPKRKSKLEILLDQYFMMERLKKNIAYWDKNIIPSSVPRIKVGSKEGFDSSVFDNEPAPLPSWEENRPLWTSCERELYEKATSALKLKIAVTDLSASLCSIQNVIKNNILSHFDQYPDIRAKLVAWNMNISDAPNDTFDELNRMWDGLRVLPCSDADIATAMSNYLILYIFSHKSYFSMLAAIQELFGDTIQVEFGPGDGSYSKSLVSKLALLHAVRPDIDSFLNDSWKNVLSQNIIGLLQVINAPDRLFDFRRFSQIFVQQIVPIQVLNKGNSKDPVFFSPARISSFGLK